jgi:beta-lactam-binding protein with PASTA domain
LLLIAMTLSPQGRPLFEATVSAQTTPPTITVPPTGAGMTLVAEDLRFFFHQIEVAQAHVASRTASNPCGTLLGPGPNQVQLFGQANAQLPLGLRTVDGSCNNLVPAPDQHLFGASDLNFPRLLSPEFKPAETVPANLATPTANPPQAAGSPTSYTQFAGNVIDSKPRLATNLIVDQTAHNPAAAAAATNPCGSGGFVCQGQQQTDGVTGTFFIPNITPDFGLSAPFNLMFTFFGQFFDHGLDLVNKGNNGSVIIPLKVDDPLFVPGADTNFMVVTRATVDANHNSVNQTTPWVDQNQTYTSHPAHQVFLRDYDMVAVNGALRPIPSGKVADGGFCAVRSNGTKPNELMCNIANWDDVKTQARTKLGIQLHDQDVFDVPLVLTDPYGHFVPGPHGFPQLVMPAGTTPLLVEGNPALNGGLGVDNDCVTGAGATCKAAARTGHQFLNDIAHNAEPDPGLVPDNDGVVSHIDPTTHQIVPAQPAGTYDGELLGKHMVTGDGRGNENIALTTMHTIFHAEHNRFRNYIDTLINTPGFLTPAEVTAWNTVDPASGWGYGERLFQAARICTEMQYQHLVFEEFARKMQPLINPFLGGITDINGVISAEFAHTVYRLGHSMLPEIIARINVDRVTGAESNDDVRLREAFLNPEEFNSVGANNAGKTPLTAPEAVGAIVRGMSRQVGNELDEFITDSVRNTLVGLPLDLGAVNIARGRSEGVPSLNHARAQFFQQTKNSVLAPYANWFEFGLNLKHRESLVNFVAAYGTDPLITGVPDCTPADGPTFTNCGLKGRRAAAQTLVSANGSFMFAPAATSGLDEVDYWIGGLAERQAAFGGLLGTTFNFVFETQLENLQNGDRFYYLQRLDGVPFRIQLEGNSLAELARRNSNAGGTMDNVFNTADFNFNAAALTATVGTPLDLSKDTVVNGVTTIVGQSDCVGCQIITQPDGTKVFFDPLHRGKNIVFNGSNDPAVSDRFMADIGDDTLYGNAGPDRLWGNDGNDTILGGDGDDVLFGGNGDDVLKGGAGNDALASGPGFGADILIGGDGNDFLLGGDDGVEHFGGPGDDIFVDGAQRAEGIFGGPGDDWIYAGDGHDGGMFGDEGNVFDLLAGVSAVGGDDVLDGGPGQDNHFGEGGDDIMLPSEGSNKFFGDFGFDWITMRSWPVRAENTGTTGFSVDLGLLALPNAPVNFNDLRNKYRFVDGASGWNLNDQIRGDDNTLCAPGEVAECFVIGMELVRGTAPTTETARRADGSVINVPGSTPPVAQVNFRGGSGAMKISGRSGASPDNLTPNNFGLVEFIAAMGQNIDDPAVPLIKGVGFMGGNILLGGEGSDELEGAGGDDLIDGDLWLNVQLRAVYNDGTVRFVDNAQDLVDDVFSDPQRLDPGNISIIRTLVTPAAIPADCGAAAPRNCDVAVFANPIAEYDISANPNGTITVFDNPAKAQGGHLLTGTDTLRNIERLRFADAEIPAPVFGVNRVVPLLIGLTQADAITALNSVRLRAGTITTGNSTTIPIGHVFSQSVNAGVTVAANTAIDFIVSIGTAVPDLTGLTETRAPIALSEAGMVLGTTARANSNTVPAGNVISQNPFAPGDNVEIGSVENIVVSLGPATVSVPTVLNLTEAAARTAITGAGLAVGTRTTIDSATVPAGSIVSQNPLGGTQVLAGSRVDIQVSTGPTLLTGLVASYGFNEAGTTTTVIDSAVNNTGVTSDIANNGTFNAGVSRVNGRAGAGRALLFNGTTGLVTIPDQTALRLAGKMTLSAWVNSNRPITESVWRDVIMKERPNTAQAPAGLLYSLYGNSDGDGGPNAYIRRSPLNGTADQHAGTATRLTPNVWTYLAATYDGTTLRTYVNGVQVGSLTAPGLIAATVGGALEIGGDALWGEFFSGMIDDVRIYNRALSATEITSLMNANIP